jgi:DNA-binding transcriptional ArsR family regulator
VPADVFAVLADPKCRHLAEVLHDGERSIGDLVVAVDIAQPGVSRHLRLLSEAGFVNHRLIDAGPRSSSSSTIWT